MKIDKAQISGTQFMFTVACFIQASSLLTVFLAAVTMQDSWLPVLSGAVFSLPLLWLYRTLMVLFPDRNLLQIFDDVYGPAAGKIIGVLYIWFFITLTALNLSELGNFTKLTLMEETPKAVLLLMCVPVSALAVRFGIRVATRYSLLFVAVAFIIVAASVLLLLNQINLQNFLPMFDQPVMKYIQGTHIMVTIPFGEVVVFLMITPSLRLSRRDISRYLFGGFVLGGITMLVVMLRDIAVLGNTLHLFTLPSLVTLRMVNVGVSLSRMEILFAIALTILLFFKVTFLHYVSVIAVAQFMKVKAYRLLSLAAGALIISYGLTLNPAPVQYIASARQTTPIIWTFFEILVPLLTFVIAKLRKLPTLSQVKEE